MKQLIFLLIICMQFSCNNKKTSTNPEERNISAETQKSTTSEVAPYADIDIKDAMSMIRKYLGSKRYIQHRRSGAEAWRDDTKCVWFKKDLIKKLYETLECEKGDGVRVYFGVYDKADDEKLLYKTVILTTTYDTVIKDVHYHYDNLKATCPDKLSMWEDIKMIPQNQGGLCPPPNDSCRDHGALLLPTRE